MKTILALNWFEAENLLLIAGITLVLLAILSVVRTPWFEVQLHRWQRLLAALLGLLLFAFWVYLFLPAKIRVVEQGVPLGGIIAWWGNWNDASSRPSGYELCDGTKVTTPDSSLYGSDKPDLLGRFPRGAEKSHLSSLASPHQGGFDYQNEILTFGTALTIEQMPSHNHDGATAKDGRHTHSTNGPSADDDGGRGSDSHFALGDANEARPWPGIQILASADSDHSHGITAQGESREHDHKIPKLDNRPSYTEVTFLIRTK